MLPDQARLHLPQPAPQSLDSIAANNEATRHWGDRMPVFAPQYAESAMATQTNTSGTFQTMTGLSFGGSIAGYQMDFTKDESWTDIEVDLRVTAFVTTGATTIRFGFSIDGGSQQSPAMWLYINEPNSHRHYTQLKTIPNLRAGKHTLELLWLGTAAKTDPNDRVQLKVTEILPS